MIRCVAVADVCVLVAKVLLQGAGGRLRGLYHTGSSLPVIDVGCHGRALLGRVFNAQLAVDHADIYVIVQARGRTSFDSFPHCLTYRRIRYDHRYTCPTTRVGISSAWRTLP